MPPAAARLQRLRAALSFVAVAAGTALAYALLAWAAGRVAMAPQETAPLYPAAGLAVACMLTWSRAGVAGVAAGTVLVAMGPGWSRAHVDDGAAWLPWAVALGACLQAAAGTWLARRFVRRPLNLLDPPDVMRFLLLVGPVACTVGAGVAALGMQLDPSLARGGAGNAALLWWIGDTTGVLVAAPLVLSLVGLPRADWAARRLAVGVPLLVAALALAAASNQVRDWDEQRVQATFDRDAQSAMHDVATRLELPLSALEAARGVLSVDPQVGQAPFQRSVQNWLLPGGPIHAIGHSVWLASPAQVPAFERAQRALGRPQFRVHDRPGGDIVRAPDEPLMAARVIEPLATNERVLGMNPLSYPVLKDAIERARRTGVPVASAGFRTVHDKEDRAAVVLAQALYRGAPRTMQERVDQMDGIAFVILRPDVLLGHAMNGLPKYLQLCLLDTDFMVARRHLAGPDACATPVEGMLRESRTISFAGRQWDLRVTAVPAAVPEAQRTGTALFMGIALACAAMLTALLLVVSGRARRVEGLVSERTAQLEMEVNERQQIEGALRETEQRLRAIFNTIPLGLRYTDREGNLLEVNPAYCQITGYSVEELRQLDFWKLTHPDDRREADLGGFPALMRGEIPVLERRKRYVRKDGEVRWVQIMVRVLGDPMHPSAKTVGVVEDITEHLRLQEADDARKAAEASNRAKSEFLSRMSHELRTPLNAILGFAQLMEMDRRHPLQQQQAQWNGQLQKAGWHLLQMIDDVLDLSRIDTGNVRLQIAPLGVNALLAETRSMIAQAAERRGLEVFESTGLRGARVLGDATRVKQILTNLLSNAVKYNRPGGSIRIALREQPKNMLAICVIDTGLGMTEEQLGNLFQPFNRLGRENSAVEGNGIGLVIARRLAELMGGALEATSAPGQGSTFTLLLPRAEDGAETAPAEPGDMADADYRSRRVHYIEDNEVNAEVMRGVLLQRPQVRLEVSANGREGIEAIRSHPPNLVLLDMHLPDMDGLQILRELQRHELTAGVPVVVVSADATHERVSAALAAGATHVLSKPVNVLELLHVLDEHLEAQPTLFD